MHMGASSDALKYVRIILALSRNQVLAMLISILKWQVVQLTFLLVGNLEGISYY